ncbi:hypothetical protein E5161_03610 [Cohnella pontilimi]|uniref:Uncharacterized protein n=1 Tax=Cohnella pontilimi TaxID=2564100 RepID=A0A4U0FHN1_9BACL|nr:hypothetical protein [Cohnella pontilimi]TJY44477.1 hypothetical protein E5161_03610 [Cohnella pontilimi]
MSEPNLSFFQVDKNKKALVRLGRELSLTRYHPNFSRFRKPGALPVDSTESVNAGLPRRPLTDGDCALPLEGGSSGTIFRTLPIPVRSLPGSLQ